MTAHATVLVVDDDPGVRALLERVARREHHETRSAATAADARAAIAAAAPDVILLDVGLPDASGLVLLEEITEDHPDIATVVVSGDGDQTTARHALDRGAYAFVMKPFHPGAVEVALYNALRRRELERDHAEQRHWLEMQVTERTLEARRACEETIARLSRAIEHRDPETSHHVIRMSRYCGLLAESYNLVADSVRTASTMHDVGKVGIPDRILLKPGRFTPDERAIMEEHTVIGAELLEGSGNALLDLAATIALTHHERWDGNGYPHGLAGEDIPLVGRIAAVADVFDALTSPRVYRPHAYTPEEALAYLRAEAGAHFDPDVVERFAAVIDEVDAIRVATPDAALVVA